MSGIDKKLVYARHVDTLCFFIDNLAPFFFLLSFFPPSDWTICAWATKVSISLVLLCTGGGYCGKMVQAGFIQCRGRFKEKKKLETTVLDYVNIRPVFNK